MPNALVMSGGGSRGAFQLGAVRYLYEQNVRPDIICGTSVGAINGAKLAEGEGSPEQGLPSLARFWLELRTNTDMWREEPWLDEIPPRFKAIITTGEAPKIAGPWTMSSAWGDIIPTIANLFSGLGWLLGDGRALLEELQTLSTKAASARAVYNLGPIAEKLSGAGGQQPAVDPAKVRAWGGGGQRKLRLAVVALESGAARYVNEEGEVLEADGQTRVTVLTTDCASLRDQVATLEAEVRGLQDELRTAVGSEKAAIIAQIRALNGQLSARELELAACMERTTATPLTVRLASAILASASIPAIFPPVRLGDETYVDGGVRELLPIRAALDLGADPIYAISASSSGVKPKGSFADAGIVDILTRSLVDIAIDEVAVNETRPFGGFGSRTVHHIEPSFDLYDITDVVPGLIRIAIDYGWLRAADVVTVDPQTRADAARLSDRICQLRYEVFSAEHLALAVDVDEATRVNHLQRAAEFKRQVRRLVEERRSKEYPVPSSADRWTSHWEWHHERQDDIFEDTTAPFGAFDEAVITPDGVRVRGWAIDPNSSAPIDVHVYVNGAMAAAGTANALRPDVGAAHPDYGEAHGFDVSLHLPNGNHRVCVYAINAGPGVTNSELGCRSILLEPAACPGLRERSQLIDSEIAALQDELRQVVGAAKARILRQIRALNDEQATVRTQISQLGCT